VVIYKKEVENGKSHVDYFLAGPFFERGHVDGRFNFLGLSAKEITFARRRIYILGGLLF